MRSCEIYILAKAEPLQEAQFVSAVTGGLSRTAYILYRLSL